jgi:alginate O-acetyltransferase complex protein AlgI
MLFNSYEFIFVFLPLTLLGYVLLARMASARAVVAFLFIASLAFYAYWSLKYVSLLLLSILVNYWLARRMTSHAAVAKRYLILGVTFNLALLGYFKYAGFFAANFTEISGIALAVQQIVLPIGISFYTFTQTAYLVDCYRQRRCEVDLIHYGLFVTIFPHLIAGPIIHHAEMLPQFRVLNRLDQAAQHFSMGASFFVIGLFKKMILADSVASFATPVFQAADSGFVVSTLEAWGGALAYTMQIYFDFSGYCDMAIGLGLMFGIRLPINFNSPYKSQSIVEFWRRWHMTLSRFLRDYLYIALGGNRRGEFRRNLNLVLTMLLGGLWHGASWTFVVWGGLHGAYLVVAHVIGPSWTRTMSLTASPALVRRVNGTMTLLLVVIGWVFFRAGTFGGALDLLTAMFCVNGCSFPSSVAGAAGWVQHTMSALNIAANHDSVLSLGDWSIGVPLILVLLVISLKLPNSQELMSYSGTTHTDLGQATRSLRWQPSLAWALTLGLAGAICILHLSRVTEFLYFQF